ncbi:VTT domain-containing protein [Patescibacteria group bacterium]|nr:VTT domain-containing protein [Patescibacteria group bacterium]MBU1034280.1 VTT domain-containing protein [Patescibacteria group bacterium]MBU1630094.1 VTT domain-containing protein [Patescibacteria group bacterium]MBU1908166.1 VTT domain-containing protein [Patescibacteria group bacterium]
MESLFQFVSELHNVQEIIRWGGYVALIAIVFAETGLFFGFFLPGDSLLVTAGLFAAKGDLNIGILFLVVSAAAIIGDATGFEIGRLSGKRIFAREDSWLFKKRHLERTQSFYEKHGGKTIVIARFMPIVRTFAPLVAGVAGMKYRRFALFNISGGIAWVGGMLGIGYFLGRVIPNIEEYIHIVIAIVIFLSILPGIISYLKSGHWKRWFEKLNGKEG